MCQTKFNYYLQKLSMLELHKLKRELKYELLLAREKVFSQFPNLALTTKLNAILAN